MAESNVSKTLTWTALSGTIAAAMAVASTYIWLQQEVKSVTKESLERLDYAVKDSDIVRRDLSRYQEESIRSRIELEIISQRLSTLQDVIQAQEEEINSLEHRVRTLEELRQ